MTNYSEGTITVLTAQVVAVLGDDLSLLVLVLLLLQRLHASLPGLALAAAGAAADLGVDEAKDVGEDITNVGQTQQHEGDPQHCVGDAHQAAPDGLGCDVTISYGHTDTHINKYTRSRIHADTV